MNFKCPTEEELGQKWRSPFPVHIGTMRLNWTLNGWLWRGERTKIFQEHHELGMSQNSGRPAREQKVNGAGKKRKARVARLFLSELSFSMSF